MREFIETGYQIKFGEVLEVIYEDSEPSLIYGIKVKLFDLTPVVDATSVNVITAKPLNLNVLRLPIVGEVVLCLRAPNSLASSIRNTLDNYYIDVVSLQNSTHHNALPKVTEISNSGATSANVELYTEAVVGNVNVEPDAKVDANFPENGLVKPLQPYVGDVIFSGRYGQSIRFSTTQTANTFTLQPKWSAGSTASPITIIRNTRQLTDTGKFNDFTTEDFSKDDSSIILASGQNLEFQQSSTNLRAANESNITSWKDEKWGKTPQVLINSGRIIFNSTQKEIIAFAKNGIALSSSTNISIDSQNDISLDSQRINLGVDANEQVVLGNQLVSVLSNILTVLQTLDGVTLVPGATTALTTSISSQLNSILSQTVYTKR